MCWFGRRGLMVRERSEEGHISSGQTRGKKTLLYHKNLNLNRSAVYIICQPHTVMLERVEVDNAVFNSFLPFHRTALITEQFISFLNYFISLMCNALGTNWAHGIMESSPRCCSLVSKWQLRNHESQNQTSSQNPKKTGGAIILLEKKHDPDKTSQILK